MHFEIFHLTRFQYSSAVTESVMELRMQPLTNDNQICTAYSLQLSPSARPFEFVDQFGNTVQHFDIPEKHSKLEITTKSLVEVSERKPLPESLPLESWKQLGEEIEKGDFWEFLLPSQFAQKTQALNNLQNEINATHEKDPLTLLREINSFFKANFEYAPETTEVDSPIDVAINQRSGVCQDFANIMIALVRGLKIPCRYVSGYLFHRTDDRSHIAQDATHAWVEAYLPTLGWVGFDPTNDLIVGDRHIAVAVGRDYTDVPPTRGVFKGNVESQLSVAVRVRQAETDEVESSELHAVKRKGFITVMKPKIQEAQQQQ
ncbi:MAG TPA: transglutaminase family protein [Pyrinomonadaceae bacterium]|nr:transglutaminase family protein [Pyrinomonadaceae bacterium]